MGQPYLSARVITSRVKTTPSTTNSKLYREVPPPQHHHHVSMLHKSTAHSQLLYILHAMLHATDAPELTFQPQIQAQRPTLLNQLYTKKPSFLAMIQYRSLRAYQTLKASHQAPSQLAMPLRKSPELA